MIEINLLPPEHRPVERTPLPRLLTIFFSVLLSATGAVAWAWLFFVAVPKAQQTCEAQKKELERVQKIADQVVAIEQELKAAKDHEAVLSEIFNQRISWARILDRFAEARAKVNTGDDVVLTKLELKKTAPTTTRGRGPELKQLIVRGSVVSMRKGAQDSELREAYLTFIRELRNDEELKKELECDEGGDGSAKCTYFGDQMSDDVKKAGSSKSKKDAQNQPEAILTFEVAFTLKSPPPPPKPAPPVVPGVPVVKK